MIYPDRSQTDSTLSGALCIASMAAELSNDALFRPVMCSDIQYNGRGYLGHVVILWKK